MTSIRDQVIEKLHNVFDPELPVNIYELGLVYEVKVTNSTEVHILMTLTAPACPVAGEILFEVENKAKEVEGVTEVHVDLTFDPPWTKDMMSEEAKLELDMF